jgi:hypothetical protein
VDTIGSGRKNAPSTKSPEAGVRLSHCQDLFPDIRPAGKADFGGIVGRIRTPILARAYPISETPQMLREPSARRRVDGGFPAIPLPRNPGRPQVDFGRREPDEFDQDQIVTGKG